jgi:hypothetical protein
LQFFPRFAWNIYDWAMTRKEGVRKFVYTKILTRSKEKPEIRQTQRLRE